MKDINLMHGIRINLNRLIIIAAVLLGLKLFTYTIEEFLPVFGSVLGRLGSALLPFILAFILAFLVEPLVERFVKTFKLKRAYSSIIVITIVILVIIMTFLFLGSRLYKEMAELTLAFPDLYEETALFITQKVDVLQNYFEVNPEVRETIYSSSQDIAKSLQDIVKKGSFGLLSFLGSLPGFMTVILVTGMATLLTSMSFPVVKEWFYARLKGKYISKAKLKSFLADLGAAFVGFLRAEIILISVTGVVTTIGLLIAGNDYAFLLGFLAGLLDLVPIIGPSLIFIPWVIILLITEGFLSALKILVIYVVAAIIRQLLEPKIMSQNIGLHPLPTLISMYVGLKLLGALGLILGPSLIVVFNAMQKAGLLQKEGGKE